MPYLSFRQPVLSRGKARNTILDAARREFAEHGLAGARVARIARRAGLNKQLIYYYFGSKDGLFEAATATEEPPSEPEGSGGATGPGYLRPVVAGLVEHVETHPELIALLVQPGRLPGGAEARAARWLASAREGLAAAVSRAQGLGHFRDDVEPQVLAHQALVLCIGHAALVDRAGIGRDEWIQSVTETLARAASW